MLPFRNAFAAALALLLPLGAAAAEDSRPKAGLFTTLPLYWHETHDLAELIASDAPPHWARGALEREFELVPLDVLGGENGTLGGLQYLVLAQPRMLAPAENVALDAWVRNGGRVLLFADPMLTEESRFPIGDKRRPQDVALLSPILARWGLELSFDGHQDRGESVLAFDGAAVPVNLAGRLARLPGAAPAACSLLVDGLVARCDIGKGRATIVADAAVLEGPAPTAEREQALAWLVGRAFD